MTISPFYIDITEVTNAAYTQCVDAGGCTAPSNTEFYADPAYSQHPVVYVNWQQAVDYCTWSAKRLPTEAEWEKAARWDPSTQTSYVWPWGNDWEPQRGNTASAELGGLSAVQAFPRDLSPWGVLDMAGNVSEWVQDWYYGDYKGLGTLNPVRNGVQPLPTAARAAHGGSFQSISSLARAGQRYDVQPQSAAPWLGFRCVQDVAGATPPGTVTAAPAETGTTPEGATTAAPAETVAPPEVTNTPVP